MLMTLILGAVAGAGAHLVEPHAARLMGLAFGEDNMPDKPAQAVAGFAVALLAAAVLLALASDGAPVVALCLGGLLGYFHREIRRAVVDRMG